MPPAPHSFQDGPSSPFEALAAAVGACTAVQPVELTDGEVTEAALGLAQLIGQAEACLARCAGVVRSRALHTVEGARSAESWLAARSELPHGRAKALVSAGRQLTACPHVEQAYLSGALGTAKVELLLAARDQVEDLFAEHEAELVERITPLTVRHAKIAIDLWRAIALATTGQDDGDAPAADDTANHFHVSSTWKGRYRLDGDLDALNGARLANLLDAERDARFRDGTWRADDGLTRAQRDAVTLVDLLERAAGATPRSRHGKPRPSIILHWDAQHLLGHAAHDVADALRRRCLLEDGTVVGRPLAERLLCSADVTDVLTYFGLDGTKVPLGVVHHRRQPTHRERAALVARDGGCVFPGCDAPVGWTEAHHTVPFELGRRTVLHELVLLCRFHHHAVHEGGFTLVRSSEGVVTVTAPGGEPLATVPPGTKVAPPAPPPAAESPPQQARPRSRFRPREGPDAP